MPLEAPRSLGSLLRVNVPREGDVSAPSVRTIGSDIRRRENPGFLGASGLPRPEDVLEPAIDQLARGPITGDATAVVTQKISHFAEIDPDQPASAREAEGDVERTAQEDIAGNAQDGLTRLLPRQGHQQLRTESFPYLALIHAPARAFPTNDISLNGLHCCSHDTGDESKREQSEPVKSYVQEPPVPGYGASRGRHREPS